MRSHAQGTQTVPVTGPLIVAANHPSSYDALVILANLNRSDYKIIVGDIPPYHYLNNISQYIIFSPHVSDKYGRMRVLRESIRHLQNGGALLIFPRGSIEPDPALMPNPEAEFNQWSRSLEIFVRHVPRTQILVTMVSGVIAQSAWDHPITWFRAKQPDRQRLAYIYQIVRQISRGEELFGLQPQVTFGELISGESQQNLTALVEQAAHRTLQKHLAFGRA